MIAQNIQRNLMNKGQASNYNRDGTMKIPPNAKKLYIKKTKDIKI